MNDLQNGDFVLLGIAAVMTLTGLLRGFSGTLAFVLASLAAAAVGTYAWTQLHAMSLQTWMQILAVILIGILVFGLVRLLVKKIVNGLLAQPADAVFGMIVGFAFALALAAIWAVSGIHHEQSRIVRQLSAWFSDGSLQTQLEDVRRDSPFRGR